MFTQCPKCETVFRLSAEALRAAGGQVRCGRCGDVFDALARLAEDAAGFTHGESSLELETRADEILHSIDEPAPEDAEFSGGPETAQLLIQEPSEEEVASDAALEFTLPPGDLDRIFIETTPSMLQLLGADGNRTERSPSAVPAEAEGAPDDALAAAAESGAHGNYEPSPTAPPPPAVERSSGDDAPAERPPGPEVSHHQHTQPDLPEINAPRRRRLPYSVWLSAAVALALLLAAQLMLSNDGWLSAHSPLRIDGALSSARLAAYQLRQWGVTGDPDAQGALRVRASIMNISAQLQPYPLLRVTLANRFGARVAEREFEPSEYLGKIPVHLLAPGERADAMLDIIDPGKDAEGFEIDVCVHGGDKKIVCAGDAASQVK